MGHICFTQCVPSAIVNDKLLPTPLVLLLSAYQFYPFLLTNLHILNWLGDIPATVGSPWLEKSSIMVSQWMHTKDITLGGKGLFSVACGYVHRDKGHKQEHLRDSWDLPTRGSHAGRFVLWNPLGQGTFPQNTTEAIQGHSHSNFIISINIKVESKPQSIETIPSPCDCPWVYTDSVIALALE